MSVAVDSPLEWLEADGLGGFASGMVAAPRSRRYHALLLTATTPPTGRMVLVNGFDAWVETPNGRYAITSQRYTPETDYHALQHENPAFRSDAESSGERLVWQPYQGVPQIVSLANAVYAADPEWYRNFLYKEEQARGLDCCEDLASPGTLQWDLSAGEAIWLLAADAAGGGGLDPTRDARATLDAWRQAERARRRQPTRLHRAAAAYVIARRRGETIIAGYPWFTDWGRDTFIAVRGLCIAAGRIDDARAILGAWAGSVSEGMLPNRFPDHGETPEFNSVDASLWYVIAVHDLLTAAAAHGQALPAAEEHALHAAVE